MIVICTKCQAKFRVADDKIGPRGAKVRCSRCQTIFLVHHDLGTMPVSPEGAVPPPPAPTPSAVAAPRLPPPLPPPLPQAPPAAPPLSDDPFAAAAAPARDPFAGADPFESAAPAAGLQSRLPVTDLSDLLGGGGSGPADAREHPSPSAASLAPAAPGLPGDFGIALEERHTPLPFSAASLPEPAPDLDVAAPHSFDLAPAPEPFAAAAFDRGAFDFSRDPREEPLAVAGEPAREPADPLGSPPDASGPPLTLQRSVRSPPAPRRVAPVAGERIAARGTSRLRAIVVNAVALAALLLVALALLVVWRSGGSLDAGALRPAAILAALRGRSATEGPFSASDVRSGVYERARGAPLLFVRGRVLSRSPAPVAAVKVSVQVVRAGEVLARGDAIAGAIPTPEELHGAAGANALAQVVAAARARAPAEVKPGDAVPFLVAIGDAPPDLDDAAIRIELAPARGAAR